MKRVAIILASLIFSVPALANQMPQHGELDSRMRYVAYNPGQVVHLSTEIGATLVIGFSDKESVDAVAETDTVHLSAVPKGNYLFFRPTAALALQPVVVLTTLPDGKRRRYVFEIETVATPSMANGSSGVYYSVQFTYPFDIAAEDAAKAAIAEKARQDAVKAAEQARTQALLKKPENDPALADRNWRYIARGDRSLTPIAVFDNGYSTVFRFPENERIPAIFVINPDGKEATAPYSVSGGYAQVGMTAREFRLRDGNTVLEVFNLAYDTMGKNPATGTVSPDVQRQVKVENTQ
ncbi:MAG: TrbG/VirB9 family P-type conjugative transfer protein [Pseudomonadota bacterium]